MNEHIGNIIPDCPKCGSVMKKRTATKGYRKGKDFWGCSNYPVCKATRNIDSEQSTVPKPKATVKKERKHEIIPDLDTRTPVAWDEYQPRKGWYSEYITVGSAPSFASSLFKSSDRKIKDALSQTYFLTNANRDSASTTESTFIGSLLSKILQRGTIPLCTVGIEEEIIKQYCLTDFLEKIDTTLSYRLSLNYSKYLSSALVIEKLNERKKFILDLEFDTKTNAPNALFDSDLEKKFFTKWVPDRFGSSAANWFIPQANLGSIMETNNLDRMEGRIDFLYVHPFSKPIAIELDGPEHNPEMDRERDDALKNCGIDTIRIKNEEIKDQSGKKLDELEHRCKNSLDEKIKASKEEELIAEALKDGSYATKVQYAIVKAIKLGWVSRADFVLEIKGMGRLGAIAVKDILLLTKALDDIYDKKISPKSIAIVTDDGDYYIDEKFGLKSLTNKTKSLKPDLRIVVEKDFGPFHEVLGEAKDDVADFIIRPANLCVTLSNPDRYFAERVKLNSSDTDTLEKPLTVFLRNIFRKEDFRPYQVKSITNALRHIDSVILLATGAGKSLIYQLAGLLMPGVTLIIDPIISLMEDQVDGLLDYGIDKAIPISANTAGGKTLLDRIGNSEYQFIFISPERLQRIKFQEQLKAMTEINLINLATIDEAHCVSEWGHNFRPAYLNLSNNLRILCNNPPFLALTGTASNAVLTDLLVELDIDPNKQDSLIRPDSLERGELHFFLIKTELGKTRETLYNTIKNLPGRFNIPNEQFFRPNQEKTSSGIVFTPHANGKERGVVALSEALKKITGNDATFFSGKPPKGLNKDDWDAHKRENAKKFKNNKISILVATKSFGMGIDKPNIRFTIHYGIPGSIESFYQEAGRAGRDRRQSFCGIIYTESDQSKVSALQDPSLSVEQLKEKQDQIKFKDSCDIDHQLYFHLNSYKGIEEEIKEVEKILEKILPLTAFKEVEIKFRTDPVLDQNGKQKRNYYTKKRETKASKSEQEKAITRLVRLGLIEKYTVEQKGFSDRYGSFALHVNPFNLEKFKKNFIEYVELTKIDEVAGIKKELEEIRSEIQTVAMKQLTKIFITFIYNAIEKQRRNALFEIVQMAQGSSDHETIRDRILYYLDEGIGSKQIKELLSQPKIDLCAWYDLMDQATNKTAISGLRGSVSRVLGDGRDNPGVRLIRSLTELLSSDCDEITASNQLYASIKDSFSGKFELTEVDSWKQILERFSSLLKNRTDNASKVIAYAFYKAISEGIIEGGHKDYSEKALSEIEDEGTKLVKNIFAIRNISDNFEEMTNYIDHTFNDEKFSSVMGGNYR